MTIIPGGGITRISGPLAFLTTIRTMNSRLLPLAAACLVVLLSAGPAAAQRSISPSSGGGSPGYPGTGTGYLYQLTPEQELQLLMIVLDIAELLIEVNGIEFTDEMDALVFLLIIYAGVFEFYFGMPMTPGSGSNPPGTNPPGGSTGPGPQPQPHPWRPCNPIVWFFLWIFSQFWCD